MMAMQGKIDEAASNQQYIDEVQYMLNAGVLKDKGDGHLEPVLDEEESEMIRLGNNSDTESVQRLHELAEKRSKRQTQIYHQDANATMDNTGFGDKSSFE